MSDSDGEDVSSFYIGHNFFRTFKELANCLFYMYSIQEFQDAVEYLPQE